MLQGLELVSRPRARPHLDLIFVHGYGDDSGSAWHHEETGKTWIKDEEFLSHLKGPVRVYSFGYNGDVAANMSAASVAFHASDLLRCLERTMSRPRSGPIVFVAHGFGGLIVKKALQLCFLTSVYHPSMTAAISSVVFFGTPHADCESGALLQAVQATASAHCHEDSVVPDEDIREYATAVAKINRWFIQNRPRHIRTLSCYEASASDAVESSQQSSETPIVGPRCREELSDDETLTMKCSHVDLPRFPSAVDARFIDFMAAFNSLISKAMMEYPRLPPLPPPKPSSSPPLAPALTPGPISPPSPSFNKRESDKKKRRDNPHPKISSHADEMYNYWSRRTLKDEETTSRQRFLRSLKGWSDPNYGSDIFVHPGTCEWFKEKPIFKDWLNYPGNDTLFYMGSPGQGKTCLARAIATHIKATHPEDEVMSFFCSRNDRSPAIGEFFTWNLINDNPQWFRHIPTRYQDRSETSPQLALGDVIDIWKELLRSDNARTIYLIIDGIEQTNREFAERFTTALRQLRRPLDVVLRAPAYRNPTELRGPTLLKVVFTCRPTEEISAASFFASRITINKDDVERDILSYLNSQLLGSNTGGAPNAPKELHDLIKKLKVNGGSYWPFIKLSVQQIENAMPLKLTEGFFSDAYIPESLAKKCDDLILPMIQSINTPRFLITTLTLLASETGRLFFDTPQLESILECLYGQEMSRLSISDVLREECDEILTVRPEDLVISFVHSSITGHVQAYLSIQQRCTNMAFVCLQYLQQDCFRDRLPLSWTDRQKSARLLVKTAPFYIRAAKHWTFYLSLIEVVSEEMLQLLKLFLSGPQYLTWAHAQAWCNQEEEDMSSTAPPAMVPLLRGGCVSVFEQFVPVPRASPATVSSYISDFVESARGKSFTSSRRLLFDAKDWADANQYLGQTTLMFAIESCQPQMVEYILRGSVDINARSPNGDTALMAAFGIPKKPGREAFLKIFFTLLRHGADPNMSNNCGMTPLHVACNSGELEALCMLLDFGAFTDVANVWGFSPLEAACIGGHFELVEKLVSSGADVDLWWSGGVTPLSTCMIDNNLEMFRLLLRVADVNQQDIVGFRPIHLAVSGSVGVEFLRLLLTRQDIDLDAVSQARHDPKLKPVNALGMACADDNYTALEMLLEAGAFPGSLPHVTLLPLSRAVSRGLFAQTKLLLAHGAPVNTLSNGHGLGTALAYAVDAGNEAMTQLLLDYGADPTTEDGIDRMGPLSVALEIPDANLNIISLLLGASPPADVNYVATGDVHALVRAVEKGNLDIVQQVLKSGADTSLWLQEGQKYSPLHEAAGRGYTEICAAILNYEPEFLNLQLASGKIDKPPLSVACEEGHHETVEFLLQKGANAQLLSRDFQESPLLAACSNGNAKTVKLVLDAAPEMVNVASFSGYSPLMCACDNGDIEVVKMLLKRGADISHRDIYGSTCVSNRLFNCEKTQPFKILEVLMQNGLDLNAVDTSDGLTALGVAICLGSVKDVKWVLDKGGDP